MLINLLINGNIIIVRIILSHNLYTLNVLLVDMMQLFAILKTPLSEYCFNLNNKYFLHEIFKYNMNRTQYVYNTKRIEIKYVNSFL